MQSLENVGVEFFFTW